MQNERRCNQGMARCSIIIVMRDKRSNKSGLVGRKSYRVVSAKIRLCWDGDSVDDVPKQGKSGRGD